MKLENYLNQKQLDLLYSNYEEFYLKLIDMENFDKVYNLLKENKFECLEDIIINYIEIFDIDPIYVELALNEVQKILGNDYPEQIKKDIRLFENILSLSMEYSDKE